MNNKLTSRGKSLDYGSSESKGLLRNLDIVMSKFVSENSEIELTAATMLLEDHTPAWNYGCKKRYLVLVLTLPDRRRLL